MNPLRRAPFTFNLRALGAHGPARRSPDRGFPFPHTRIEKPV
jgi:hypothetical protein